MILLRGGGGSFLYRITGSNSTEVGGGGGGGGGGGKGQISNSLHDRGMDISYNHTLSCSIHFQFYSSSVQQATSDPSYTTKFLGLTQ